MPRIYLPPSRIKNSKISITGEKAKYLKSVLRCRKGDDLVIFDGGGNCFKTIILKIDRKEVLVEVIEQFHCDVESNINVILVQGVLKGEKMGIVIQKATELGVKEIIPVITERSQIRKTDKITRWKKIAEEAARQSGRSLIPVVREPAEFKKFISMQTYPSMSPLAKGESKVGGFIFYEEERKGLSSALSSFVPPSSFFIIIGPEGGFTKEEVNFARQKGLIVTSLGRRILRAETAAIAAVTLIQFLLGDLGYPT